MSDQGSRIAVVTGGGSGIGYAIAEALLAEGFVLVIAARGLARLEDAATKLRSRGGRVVCVRCDVASEDDVAQLAARTQSLAEALDAPIEVVVNDAGLVDVHDVLDSRVDGRDVYATALDVNHLGAVRVSEAFLPDMVDRGRGLVVQVASSASLRPFPRIAAYTTSKHALLGWTRAAAEELAAVRRARGLAGGPALVVLCPYYVRGEMLERAVAGLARELGCDHDTARQHIESRNPGAVLVEPRAIAAHVVELVHGARADGSRVNGRVVVFPGGPPRPPDPTIDRTP